RAQRPAGHDGAAAAHARDDTGRLTRERWHKRALERVPRTSTIRRSEATMTTAGASPGTPMILPTPERDGAVDAYRGLVMVLMMAEVIRLERVAAAYPDSAFLGFLAFHQSHVPWSWLSLHDLIQPSFSFLVGVALPYSFASRMKRTGSYSKLFLHAVWRAIILIVLGIFLRSM